MNNLLNFENLGSKKPFISKAKKLAKKVGFRFEEGIRPFCSLSIDNSVEGVQILSPITFRMSEDTLIDMGNRLKSLGYCGYRAVKALVDAVNELEQETIDDLRTCCFNRQYNAVQVLRYLSAVFHNMVEKQGVKINTLHMTVKSARNLWISFGGYRGLKALFTDCLFEVIGELRRIRRLEERMNVNKVIDVDNPLLDDLDMGALSFKTIACAVSKCLTCKYCKVDRYGDRICKEGYVDIPEDLSVDQVNKMYPSASVLGYGELVSRYIMFPIGECDCYRSRIGYSIKDHQRSHTNNQEVHDMKVNTEMA